MYVIVSYDIAKKRVGKALKICRKYLQHAHRSVFEGEITEAKLRKLKHELADLADPTTDSVKVYRVAAPRFVVKEELGQCESSGSII